MELILTDESQHGLDSMCIFEAQRLFYHLYRAVPLVQVQYRPVKPRFMLVRLQKRGFS